MVLSVLKKKCGLMRACSAASSARAACSRRRACARRTSSTSRSDSASPAMAPAGGCAAAPSGTCRAGGKPAARFTEPTFGPSRGAHQDERGVVVRGGAAGPALHIGQDREDGVVQPPVAVALQSLDEPRLSVLLAAGARGLDAAAGVERPHVAREEVPCSPAAARVLP